MLHNLPILYPHVSEYNEDVLQLAAMHTHIIIVLSMRRELLRNWKAPLQNVPLKNSVLVPRSSPHVVWELFNFSSYKRKVKESLMHHKTRSRTTNKRFRRITSHITLNIQHHVRKTELFTMPELQQLCDCIANQLSVSSVFLCSTSQYKTPTPGWHWCILQNGCQGNRHCAVKFKFGGKKLPVFVCEWHDINRNIIATLQLSGTIFDNVVCPLFGFYTRMEQALLDLSESDRRYHNVSVLTFVVERQTKALCERVSVY